MSHQVTVLRVHSMSRRSVEIVDVTFDPDRERFLYGCLVSKHPRKYQRRREYLDTAIPNGFRKKILIFGGDVVGTIEYAPPEAAGYPIQGKNIMIVNCIWVLRRAKGHRLGTRLIEDMMQGRAFCLWFRHDRLGGSPKPLVQEEPDREARLQVDQLGLRHP